MSSDLETLPSQPTTRAGSRTQLQIEDLGKWRRRLTIVVLPETVRREREHLLRDYARRIKLPGFRPGRAPLELLRKRLGADIEGDLGRKLLEMALREAIEEHRLAPISTPTVTAAGLDESDTFRATAELDVRPEISLPRTGGFQIERAEPHVGPEAVERVLERLREERAELTTLAKPAARGDVVVIEVASTGEVGAEEEPRRTQILLGAGETPPELEARLEGTSTGTEFDVQLQERGWHVKVLEVQERKLPELDDAFAAQVSRASNLEELRRQIAENLQIEAAAEAERSVRDQLIEALAEANGVQVPESMIGRYVERMLQPAERTGTRHLQGPEQRLGAGRHRHSSGQDMAEAPAGHGEGHGPVGQGQGETAAADHEAELARLLQPAAERSLRRLLIVDAVARDHGLEPTEQEIEAYLRQRAESSENPEEAVREARRSLERKGGLDELRFHLRGEKVFEFLKAQSVIHQRRDDL